MTATQTESMSPDELLASFKTRYENLITENKQMSQKIRENEQTALKLLGAIETLEYLNPPEVEIETAEEGLTEVTE